MRRQMAYPTHPGETIGHCLADSAMTATELASGQARAGRRA